MLEVVPITNNSQVPHKDEEVYVVKIWAEHYPKVLEFTKDYNLTEGVEWGNIMGTYGESYQWFRTKALATLVKLTFS